MHEQETLEVGRVIAGRYEVLGQLGAGGMGAVYLVRHVHTDEQLALKVLLAHALRDASAVERFRREARAPARIASEHVARVTDADTAADLGDVPFLVMELLRGEDLGKALERQTRLSPDHVVEVLRQTARALDKAHGLGIVHRDLKPENLFLTKRDDGSLCVKLLDFGIARLGDSVGGSDGTHKTQAGNVFGTPAYMAPEQMTGDIERIGAATDIWAFGLVAFRLLVGADFWLADSLPQLYALVLGGAIPRASERGSALGAGFDAWFARCVARESDARFRTAGEAAEALATALATRELPVLAQTAPPADFDGAVLPPPRLPPPPIPAQRPRWLWMAAGGMLALMLVAAASLALFASASTPDPPRASGAPRTTATTASLLVSATAAPPSVPAPTPAPTVVAASTVPLAVAPNAAASPAPRDEAPDPEAIATAVPAPRPPPVRLDRDQQNRLSVLQKLCDQGTVTAAECGAKRAAILRGDP